MLLDQMNFYPNGTFRLTSVADAAAPLTSSNIELLNPYIMAKVGDGVDDSNFGNSLSAFTTQQTPRKFSRKLGNMMRGSTPRKRGGGGELVSASFTYTDSRIKVPVSFLNRTTPSPTALLLTAATTISTGTGRALGSRLLAPMLVPGSHEDAAVLADLASSGHSGHGGPPHGGLTVENSGVVSGGRKPSHEHAEHEVQLIAAISLLVLVIVVGIVGQAIIVVCGACEACFSENDPHNFSADEESEGQSIASGARNKINSFVNRNKLAVLGSSRSNLAALNQHEKPLLGNRSSAPLLKLPNDSSSNASANNQQPPEGESIAAAMTAAGLYLAAAAAASDVGSSVTPASSSSVDIFNNSINSTASRDQPLSQSGNFTNNQDNRLVQIPPPSAAGHQHQHHYGSRRSGLRYNASQRTTTLQRVSFLDGSIGV